MNEVNDYQQQNINRAVLIEIFEWAIKAQLTPEYFLAQGIPEDEMIDALIETLEQRAFEEYGLEMCPCCILNHWTSWMDEINDQINIEEGI